MFDKDGNYCVLRLEDVGPCLDCCPPPHRNLPMLTEDVCVQLLPMSFGPEDLNGTRQPAN